MAAPKRPTRVAVKARQRAQAREVERMFRDEPDLAAVTFSHEIVGKEWPEPLTPADYAAANREAYKLSRKLWERGSLPSDAPRSRDEIEADIELAKAELADLAERL
jgi:hypothetical protein